ncbi:unnamed protein product [Aureobasidium uvarum]|uniref:Stress response RCI peptide n=1 Tax=Aureobasidium uvarum TaxID=2773716 RepID=A0A9N8KFG8_9PEZI|nr:unnamed protein product [Aureobasidium uvarum]
MCGSDIFLGFLAILFPPIAVWVKRGICSADSFINIALCCLGILPGLIHAWYIISRYPDPTYDELAQEPEGGRVTYYYVQQSHRPSVSSSRGPGYGTITGAPSSQAEGSQPQQYRQDQQMPSASKKGDAANPPTYAEAVKGDNKTQSHD